MKAGLCRFCGCSERDACLVDDEPCTWTDQTLTVCTACAPAAAAEAQLLAARARGGWRPGLRVAFHRGFVVGWFSVRARNPYVPTVAGRGHVWSAGKYAGQVARQIHVAHYGPIPNRRHEGIPA
jgi:hypothetical protein